MRSRPPAKKCGKPTTKRPNRCWPKTRSRSGTGVSVALDSAATQAPHLAVVVGAHGGVGAAGGDMRGQDDPVDHDRVEAGLDHLQEFGEDDAFHW